MAWQACRRSSMSPLKTTTHSTSTRMAWRYNSLAFNSTRVGLVQSSTSSSPSVHGLCALTPGNERLTQQSIFTGQADWRLGSNSQEDQLQPGYLQPLPASCCWYGTGWSVFSHDWLKNSLLKRLTFFEVRLGTLPGFTPAGHLATWKLCIFLSEIAKVWLKVIAIEELSCAGAELVFNVTMVGNSLGDKDW